MSSHPAAIAAAVGLFIGGVATAVDHTLSFVAVVTAVLTGASRYYAILRGADKDQVERATAYGFFVGALLSAILLVLDRVVVG